MICSKCKEEIPAGDEMSYRGKIFCEDCYVLTLSVPKTCDVAAVHSAKMARQQAGQTGTDGLTELQKALYEYVEANDGKVPMADVMKNFELSETEMTRVFAPLRHCELLKATMIDGVKYCLLMEGGPGSM